MGRFVNGPLRSRPSEKERHFGRKLPKETMMPTHLAELWHKQQSRQGWDAPTALPLPHTCRVGALPACTRHSLGVGPAVRLRPLHCQCNPASIRPRAPAFEHLLAAPVCRDFFQKPVMSGPARLTRREPAGVGPANQRATGGVLPLGPIFQRGKPRGLQAASIMLSDFMLVEIA
jgi:hypothetical protein